MLIIYGGIISRARVSCLSMLDIKPGATGQNDRWPSDKAEEFLVY